MSLWPSLIGKKTRRLAASTEEHAQCLVKLATFRCAEALALLYSVLLNRVTRGFYSFRKSSEIKFENGSVVQLLPRGMGHASRGCKEALGKFRGYCASAVAALARSRMSSF